MTRGFAFLIIVLVAFLSVDFPAQGATGVDKDTSHFVSSHDPPTGPYFLVQSDMLRTHDARLIFTTEAPPLADEKKTFPVHARIEQDPSHSYSFIVSRQEKKRQHSFFEKPWIDTNAQATSNLQVSHTHFQTHSVPPDERDAPGRRSDDPRAGPRAFSGIPAEKVA